MSKIAIACFAALALAGCSVDPNAQYFNATKHFADGTAYIYQQDDTPAEHGTPRFDAYVFAMAPSKPQPHFELRPEGARTAGENGAN